MRHPQHNRIQAVADRILETMDASCDCNGPHGGAEHTPDCSFMLAMDDAWLLAMEEIEEPTMAMVRAACPKFFEPGAMRFFDSRIETDLIQGIGGIYFITSERFDETTPRCFTLRRFNPATGAIGTVGEFNVIRTLGEARVLAISVARGLELIP